jgi:hypothetical protein
MKGWEPLRFLGLSSIGTQNALQFRGGSRIIEALASHQAKIKVNSGGVWNVE